MSFDFIIVFISKWVAKSFAESGKIERVKMWQTDMKV